MLDQETAKATNRQTQSEFNLLNFEGLKISVAGSDEILKWSYGEVLKPETINYRTQKPERDGLFDERIFGPTKDWECYCGKYKRIRYKGVICDKCGVEVTRSSVRRERIGHIDLAVPVAHIWYVRSIPYVISSLLDISVNDLEKVIYFAAFIIVDVDETLKEEAINQLESEFRSAKENLQNSAERLEQLEINYRRTKSELNSLQSKMILPEGKYQEISMRFGNIIKVGIGAEAILELLRKINLNEQITTLKLMAKQSPPSTQRRLTKQLRLMMEMRTAGIKPEWLIITKLPVLPPDLRPMVQLDGGRYASSDLNDLYRRVISRNNRLKRLMNQGAPDVIVRNEKRMLQEAVDSLIDNSARKSQTTLGGRQPKSLSDMLRGKQGRFRQNLLGKRVDYSGRSVIVIGPDLRLDQCGIPKIMALELYKPFVISKLIKDGYVHNVKNATRLIERGTPEVWEILEEITSQSHVLLNRAPTLHRLGIQAFRPVLIEGKAIQLHPLVCYAYNADFDGDQMAVHVPLSVQAKAEAKDMMLSTENLLKPASGETLVSPRLDIVFGLYYLTTKRDGSKGENRVYMAIEDILLDYQQGLLHPQASILLKIYNEKIQTTVGRAIFNSYFPRDYPYLNEQLNSKTLKKIIRDFYKRYGKEMTAVLADNLKDLGFKFAEKSGMTMSIGDINAPKSKTNIIAEGEALVDEINKRYSRGLINDNERRKLSINKWSEIRQKVEKEMIESFDRTSPVWSMADSGARGSVNQLTQLAGMKGLVVNPAGEIIEVPITSNYKEGLSVLEYFISTHGSRKGKSDTSLKTADAGYLTRRLVDVAQDIVITSEDCGSDEFLTVCKSQDFELAMSFEERLIGRVTAEKIIGKDNKTILKQGEEITEDNINKIIDAGVQDVKVRTVLGCKNDWGVCKNCYGRDLATGKMVELGSAVGIMAAQAIGEPGTQLTMKTFHMGGVSVGDITSGLPRVEEVFEARPPHNGAILAEFDGFISIHEVKDDVYIDLISDIKPEEEYYIPDEYQIVQKNGDIVKEKQAIATAVDRKAIRTNISGKVSIEGRTVRVKSTEPLTATYQVNPDLGIKVKSGDKVKKGDILTEGHIDLNLSLQLRGIRETQNYIINEVQAIYSSHGADVNEKHIEIIVKAMFSKVRITDGGDSNLLSGSLIDRLSAEMINKKLISENKKPVIYDQVILGITRAALNTNSFLSAASFQETTSVLIKSAIKGAIDPLKGLKENVIIGKLIPAGSGFSGNQKSTNDNNLEPINDQQ